MMALSHGHLERTEYTCNLEGVYDVNNNISKVTQSDSVMHKLIKNTCYETLEFCYKILVFLDWN